MKHGEKRRDERKRDETRKQLETTGEETSEEKRRKDEWQIPHLVPVLQQLCQQVVLVQDSSLTVFQMMSPHCVLSILDKEKGNIWMFVVLLIQILEIKNAF